MGLFKSVQPTANIAPAQKPMEPAQYLASSRETGVITPLLQNAAGGFSAGLLVFMGGMLVTGNEAQADVISELNRMGHIGLVAFLIGATVFCVATMIRAFRDEVSFLLAVVVRLYVTWHDGVTIRSQVARIAALEATIKELGIEAQARNEYEVQTNAFRMLALALMSNPRKSISRESCRNIGINKAAWGRAIKMLRNAGLMDEHQRLIADDYADAIARLQVHLANSALSIKAADGTFYKM